jgi:site-specific recombinase XerD
MGARAVKGKSSTVGEGVTPVDPNGAILSSWELSLHGKAEGTRRLYLRCAGWFADWLRANGHSGDLLAVTRQDAEGWFAAQRSEGKAPTTLRSRWIALRNLYGWLTDEDELDANPLARVRVEKVEPPPIEVLTPEKLRALLKVCEGKGFHDRRDTAIVRLFAATGMRLSELATLRLADVDLAKRVAFIEHGKGDRARFVRFDAGTATALDRYLRARGRHAKAALGWLWLSRNGRFTNKGIPLMLERRAEAAGIGHLHAHMFRHTWADAWLSAGGNEGDLQRLGGWENADVMRRYGSARAVDRALAAYDDVNPLGQL